MFEVLKRGISKVREDIRVIYDNDPAAKNLLEVILCYPGLHALIAYRFAHRLYKWHIPLIPRVISYFTRIITGIEIHPGARIGRRVFIDQQVTLGGTGKELGKRHPTLGNNVIIGAGEKVLGNITVGDYIRVGAGSVVIEDVPEYSTVVGIPGRIVHRAVVDKQGNLMHNRIPDPIRCEINKLKAEVEILKEKVDK